MCVRYLRVLDVGIDWRWEDSRFCFVESIQKRGFGSCTLVVYFFSFVVFIELYVFFVQYIVVKIMSSKVVVGRCRSNSIGGCGRFVVGLVFLGYFICGGVVQRRRKFVVFFGFWFIFIRGCLVVFICISVIQLDVELFKIRFYKIL